MLIPIQALPEISLLQIHLPYNIFKYMYFLHIPYMLKNNHLIIFLSNTPVFSPWLLSK